VPTVSRLKKKLSDKKCIIFTHRLQGKEKKITKNKQKNKQIPLANSPVLLVTPVDIGKII
jgi:hypothetical protein